MKPTYSLFHRLLDIIAPTSCCCCHRRLTQQEQFICVHCLRHLPYTQQHLSPQDNEVARLFWKRLPIQHAATLYQHLPHADSARIIYAIKYGQQPELALYMGKLIAETFSQHHFFDDITAIVPVPLTAKRQKKRGYNQSQLIAEGIAEVTQLPVHSQWIQRKTFTKSQTHLTTAARADNVEDAFTLLTPHTPLDKEHILLVDDVITTGATICACAQTLINAGVRKISVAALCFSKT